MADRLGEDQASLREGGLGSIPNPSGAVVEPAETPFALRWHSPLWTDAPDPEGKVWDVTIIEAGKSLNGPEYPASVLERDAHIFEGLPIHTYKWDPGRRKKWHEGLIHLDEKARSRAPYGLFANYVGQIKNVRWDATKRAVVGQAFIDDEDTRAKLLNAWDRKAYNLVGLSIDARGVKRGDSVVAIRTGNSVEIVTNPAAGGGFDRLVAGCDEPVDLEDQAWDLRCTAGRIAEGGLSAEDQRTAIEGMQAVLSRMAESVNGTEAGESSAQEDQMDEPTADLQEQKTMQQRWKEVGFLADKLLAGGGSPAEMKAMLQRIKSIAEKTLSTTYPAARAATSAETTPTEGDGGPVSAKEETMEQEQFVQASTADALVEAAKKPLEEKGREQDAKIEELQALVESQAIKHELEKLGAEFGLVDLDATSKLLDVSNVTVSPEGEVTGLREAVEALIEKMPFLVAAKKPDPAPTVALNEATDPKAAVPEQVIRSRMNEHAARALQGDIEAAVEYDKLRETLV